MLDFDFGETEQSETESGNKPVLKYLENE